MITDILLMSLLIFSGIGFSLFLIITLAIEFIKDRREDKMGEQIQLLKDNGYQVEVDKGIIYIVLDSKDYFNLKSRDKVKDLMKNYSKSYGLKIKENEDESIK